MFISPVSAVLALGFVASVALSERTTAMDVEVLRETNIMKAGDAVHVIPVRGPDHRPNFIEKVVQFYYDFREKETEFYNSCFADGSKHVCDKEFTRKDGTKGTVILLKLVQVDGLAQFKRKAPAVYRELAQLSIKNGYRTLVFPPFCEDFKMKSHDDRKESMRIVLDLMNDEYLKGILRHKLIFFAHTDQADRAWESALNEYKGINIASRLPDDDDADQKDTGSGTVYKQGTNRNRPGFVDTVRKNKILTVLSIVAVATVSFGVYYKATSDKRRTAATAAPKV